MSERAFDKFTKRAKQVLQIATEEARAFNHPYIGTEHILLGLIKGEYVEILSSQTWEIGFRETHDLRALGRSFGQELLDLA